MAVARHPVARIAPPAPAIISASRARVGERDGERGADHASRAIPKKEIGRSGARLRLARA